MTAVPVLANPVPAANGGTGQSSYAVGDIIYASGATTLAKLADVATGNALISGGVGVAPSWGKIGLTTHVSGTLAVSNGGTGAATFTANRSLWGNGTSAISDDSGFTRTGAAGRYLFGVADDGLNKLQTTSFAATSIVIGSSGISTPNAFVDLILTTPTVSGADTAPAINMTGGLALGSGDGGTCNFSGGGALGAGVGGSFAFTAGTGGGANGELYFVTGLGAIALEIADNGAATTMGFFGASPVGKPNVTGSRGGNAALASLCTALANLGLITNSTS